jgi:hypothetical protein
MADEQEAIAPIEQAQPAIVEAAIEIKDEPELIPEPGEELETETTGEPEPIEEIEIDWDDGKKYKIPKALETGILKNKDYTQKSQANAERTKALEARDREIEERHKATDEELDARAELRTLDTQLAEFAKLSPADWQAHSNANPKATEDAWRTFQLLKQQRTEKASILETRQTERTQRAQQDFAKRVEATLEHAKKIPGWKPDTVKDLVEFAQTMGVTEDVIKQNWSPTFIDILHRAHLGDQLLKKQATAPKLPTPTPAKPLETVGGKGNPGAGGTLESLAASDNMEAFAKALNAKLAKR